MRAPLSLLLALPALLAGCRQDMHDAPYLEADESSAFFEDGRASRPRVPGTVARGRLDLDDHLHRGTVDGELAATWPFEVTPDVLARGRERYAIFCAPCHGATGAGDGLVVQRGLRAPPSLHEPRLVEASPGYVFDVITNGFGAMYDYADRIPPRDRWAIAAHMRVLQTARLGRLEDVPADERARLLEERP